MRTILGLRLCLSNLSLATFELMIHFVANQLQLILTVIIEFQMEIYTQIESFIIVLFGNVGTLHNFELNLNLV